MTPEYRDVNEAGDHGWSETGGLSSAYTRLEAHCRRRDDKEHSGRRHRRDER